MSHVAWSTAASLKCEEEEEISFSSQTFVPEDSKVTLTCSRSEASHT